MRIISDFKDYYDSVMGIASDPGLTYLRKQRVYEFTLTHRMRSIFDSRNTPVSQLPVELPDAFRVPAELILNFPLRISKEIKWYGVEDYDVPITAKIIGFCGKLYSALAIDNHTFYDTEQISSTVSDSFWRSRKLDREMVEILLLQKEKHRARWHPLAQSLTHENWTHVNTETVGHRFDDVFIRASVPLFKLEYFRIDTVPRKDKYVLRCTLNPELRHDRFQSVFGPAEAFQEISMYLGNQLAQQPDPTSTIPDDILRDEKGFDEWSFRRHKEDDKKFVKKQRRKGR